MTDREKAIVTAHTGINMLEGEKFNEFYKYLEELYGRPVYTHEIPFLDIQEKSKEDFIALCRGDSNANKWIPVPERLPEEGQKCLVCDNGSILIDTFIGRGNPYNWRWYVRDYEAWMPLPEPYGGESDEIHN